MSNVVHLKQEAVPLQRWAQPPCCPLCGSPQNPRLMVAHIQALVAAYYGLLPRDMTTQDRRFEVSHPRQVAMYLSHELTSQSLVEIGTRFGGKDHSTVLHAVKAVQRRMLCDPELEADVAALRARLRG
jgi:chromosomal replication initiator protein